MLCISLLPGSHPSSAHCIEVLFRDPISCFVSICRYQGFNSTAVLYILGNLVQYRRYQIRGSFSSACNLLHQSCFAAPELIVPFYLYCLQPVVLSIYLAQVVSASTSEPPKNTLYNDDAAEESRTMALLLKTEQQDYFKTTSNQARLGFAKLGRHDLNQLLIMAWSSWLAATYRCPLSSRHLSAAISIPLG